MSILPVTANETGKMVRPLALASSPIHLGIKPKTVGEKTVTKGAGRLIGEALTIGLPGGRQVGRVFGRLMVLPQQKVAAKGADMSDVFPFLLTPQTRVKLAKRWQSRKTHPARGVPKKERSKLVSKARKGQDVGGGGFEEVAAKASKEYGSAKRGRRVAAAQMWKMKRRGQLKAAKPELLPITRAMITPVEELEKTGDQLVASTGKDETITLLPITQGVAEKVVGDGHELLPITKQAAGETVEEGRAHKIRKQLVIPGAAA